MQYMGSGVDISSAQSRLRSPDSADAEMLYSSVLPLWHIHEYDAIHHIYS